MTLPAGLHCDVPDAVYRADPCAEPSLTQSAAKILLTLTPAHWKYRKPEPTKKFDIGHIAHRLILGRGGELEIVPGDDWVKDRKAKAQMREDARQRNVLAVLSKDHATGQAMYDAFHEQMEARGYAPEWVDADYRKCAEVVAIAQADVRTIGRDGTLKIEPIYLRAMIDWLPSLTRVWDYKTSAMSCEASIRASLPDWCIQAAMHERILNILDPGNAGRREHRYVAHENFEPYALQVVRLSEVHLTIGREQVAMAENIWARCQASGEWPAYPLGDVSPKYPSYALAKIMEEDNG